MVRTALHRLGGSHVRGSRVPLRHAAKTNSKGIPYWSLIAIGVIAVALAMTSGLSRLVEAASLAFLVTFAVVAWIAWHEHINHRWAAGLGLLLATTTMALLAWRLATHQPWTLVGLGALVVLATFGRKYLVRWTRVEGPTDP